MMRARRSRIIFMMLTLPQFVMPPTASLAGIFGKHKGPDDGPITLQEAASCVDLIDKKLFSEGTIGVKAPDVWGQNRMTVYRAEFEDQMKTRLSHFQLILQAAQSRTDIAALTSATSLGATVAAAQSGKSGRFAAIAPKSFNVAAGSPPTFSGVFPSGTLTATAGAMPAASLTPPAPTPAAPASPTPADPGNPDFAEMAAQLAAIAARVDTLKQGALTLPSNINTFVTQAGKTGVGIEPTVAIDEEANYLNHLHQLRRVNAGDDLTDMAGYGLYLMRMPVSLMPGPESRKGRGAVVTVEARHDLTDDLLPNTFRDVAILDLTYALTQIVNEEMHQNIFRKCHSHAESKKKPADRKKLAPNPMKYSQFDGPKTVSGPNPFLLEDLRLILGPIEPPTEDDLWMEENDLWEGEKKVADDAPPSSITSASRAKPAGRGLIAKRDEVVRTQMNPGGPPTGRRYQTILANRLNLLVEAMESSQCDPYRHDPSTLSLFQASIIDVYRYMRENANKVDLFQVPKIEALGELLMRRDYTRLKLAREQFLQELYCFRKGWPIDVIPPATWVSEVEPSDVLAFALLLQFINVDRQLKWDIRCVAQRRGCNCGDVEGLCFYEFEPTAEARNAFKDYVACKWPLHIYSVDPVLDQQNVLDAYSRRTELQLALAVGVATGQFNIKNATSFARQLDLDLQTVGLNRTSVGFGAGETTFGWMFYPRVQTPQPASTFRTFTNTLTGTGQGINADLRSRRIEPGQRECVALMVTPNFIPSIKVSTVTNWFDVTGHHAKQQLNNREMLELSRMLQQAKAAVARACDSHEYRATDFTVLNQRIKQLEALLPTQDTRVDLPDEGDLLGSEIFSSNAAGLSPALLAWYGEPVQDGTAGSIFLQGRGFSVSETQVIVGGIPLHQGTEFKLISRNVMQIIVPAKARSVKVQCDQDHAAKPATPPVAVASVKAPARPAVEARGGLAEVQVGDNQRAHAELDPKLSPDVNVTVDDGKASANARGSKVDIQVGAIHAHAEGDAKPEHNPCDRAVIDVHIATPNGISNHLYVEVISKTPAPKPQNAVTTATTTTTVHGNTTTTSTKFETTPPGTVLPPLTVLPMGTNWPPATMLSPGPITGAPAGSLLPGLVPPAAATPASTLTLTPPAAPAPNPAPKMVPAAPAAPAPAPAAPAPAAPVPAAPVPAISPIPATSSASPMIPADREEGQVGVAALQPPSISGLPPLPSEAPKVVVAPANAGAPSARRVRPPILRRIGLPDR